MECGLVAHGEFCRIASRWRGGNCGRDHDHCAFCHAEFAAARTDHVDFTAGYVTADDNYTWICQPCLEDLNDQFQWNVLSAPTDP